MKINVVNNKSPLCYTPLMTSKAAHATEVVILDARDEGHDAPPAAAELFPARDKDTALAALTAALERGKNVYVAASLVPDLARVVPTMRLGKGEFVSFPAPRRALARDVAKRLTDIALAIALILFLLPAWLPMFAAIKIDSRGPIIFRQKRLTKNRREFNIYKFRTMFATVPQYQRSPTAKDIRITRVGRLLRLLGLDETAQLINVLKGQMSLVGPRPEMAVAASKYEPWQNFRFTVKPGITGLWQIAGRADRPISDGLEFDFYYITQRNLLLDIKIFLKTIPILFGKGKPH